MKGTFSMNGMEMKPTAGGSAGQYSPVTDVRNKVMAAMPPPLLDSNGFVVQSCPAYRACGWQWADRMTDGIIASPGLATRGLFAQHMYEALFTLPRMKLCLCVPAVNHMSQAAVSFRESAKDLSSSSTESQLSGLQAAHGVVRTLSPRLEHSNFPTTVGGGAKLKEAAKSLGRGAKDTASGCSTAGPTKVDGVRRNSIRIAWAPSIIL
eukprot:3280153-Prymnesium_polylepis.1